MPAENVPPSTAPTNLKTERSLEELKDMPEITQTPTPPPQTLPSVPSEKSIASQKAKEYVDDVVSRASAKVMQERELNVTPTTPQPS
ncbi:MAG: hypothetical protein V2I33_20025 [Kangiellaceae bacterium]|jgi:hypothetical protein|nr:hypothetical protein [Kangiellaceae bacterium]